jgi:YebC/PmpR family DNA-binding regulatory protein
MARHSKWHKVKQFKGAIDAKRSASFTKLAREITVAAREKGGDPTMNARLRAAIDRARAGSMPRDNIERAIQRGAGGGKDGEIEALTYEAYAPGGTALIIECLTDNRNRTANDVKHLLSEAGASLAASGSVTFGFDRVGVVRLPVGLPADRHDEIELALIDAGAADVVAEEGGAVEVRTAPNDLAKVADAAAQLGLEADAVEFQWIPKNLVETDETTGTAVAELIDELDAHDDVSRVFSNLA